MDNPNDVKELIPEFFYFPEFLENQNGEFLPVWLIESVAETFSPENLLGLHLCES